MFPITDPILSSQTGSNRTSPPTIYTNSSSSPELDSEKLLTHLDQKITELSTLIINKSFTKDLQQYYNEILNFSSEERVARIARPQDTIDCYFLNAMKELLEEMKELDFDPENFSDVNEKLDEKIEILTSLVEDFRNIDLNCKDPRHILYTKNLQLEEIRFYLDRVMSLMAKMVYQKVEADCSRIDKMIAEQAIFTSPSPKTIFETANYFFDRARQELSFDPIPEKEKAATKLNELTLSFPNLNDLENEEITDSDDGGITF